MIPSLGWVDGNMIMATAVLVHGCATYNNVSIVTFPKPLLFCHVLERFMLCKMYVYACASKCFAHNRPYGLYCNKSTCGYTFEVLYSIWVTVKAATLIFIPLGLVRLFHLLNRGYQVLFRIGNELPDPCKS